jgi:hypothetical protein
MVKPVDSASSATSGESQEKYDAEQKRGPGKFDETLEKSRAERLKDMADKVKIAPLPQGTPHIDAAVAKMEELKQQMEARKAARAAAKGGGGGSGAVGNIGQKRTPEHKKGGVIKSASSRADGCCIRGKTKA